MATNGTVVVLAESGPEAAFIYEFEGTNVHRTHLIHLDSAGNTDETCMSRDGEFVVGELQSDSYRFLSLWS